MKWVMLRNKYFIRNINTLLLSNYVDVRVYSSLQNAKSELNSK